MDWELTIFEFASWALSMVFISLLFKGFWLVRLGLWFLMWQWVTAPAPFWDGLLLQVPCLALSELLYRFAGGAIETRG